MNFNTGSELELFDLDKPNNQDNLEATSSKRAQKFQNFISAVTNPGKAIFENTEDKKLTGSNALKYREAAIVLLNTSITLAIIGISTYIIGIALSCSLPVIVIAGILLASGLIAAGASIVYNIKAKNTNFEFCRDTKLPELRKKINQKAEKLKKNLNEFRAQIDKAGKNLDVIQTFLNNKNVNNTEQLDPYLEALSNNEAFCYTQVQTLLQQAEKNLSKEEEKHYFVLGIRLADDISSEDQNIRKGALMELFNLAQESSCIDVNTKLRTEMQDALAKLENALQGQTKSNKHNYSYREQLGETNPFDDPEEKP